MNIPDHLPEYFMVMIFLFKQQNTVSSHDWARNAQTEVEKMALRNSNLCTLDSHPHSETLSCGILSIAFSLKMLLHSTLINVFSSRKIPEFKPVQFLHLYVNEGGNFQLMRSCTYLFLR